jgi:hypothetical protein
MVGATANIASTFNQPIFVLYVAATHHYQYQGHVGMRDEYASIGFATAKLPILGDFIA